MQNLTQSVSTAALTNPPAPEKKIEIVNRSRVDSLKRAIDPRSRVSIMDFGNEAQSKVANFSSEMARKVMATDAGPIYEELARMRDITSGLKEDELNPKSVFDRLFFSAKKAVARFTERFMTVDYMIESIKANIERLIKDRKNAILVLDKQYDMTLEHFDSLTDAIAAGQEALASLRIEASNEVVEAAKLEENGETGAALKMRQSARDLGSNAELLDRKIVNLQKSRAVAMMSLPAIRSLQETSSMMIDSAHTVIAHAIPTWKQQMLLCVEGLRQKEGLDSLAASTDFTGRIILSTQKQLADNARTIRQETLKGYASIDAVTDAMKTLVSSINECTQLDAAAAEERKRQREALLESELSLKEALEARSEFIRSAP